MAGGVPAVANSATHTGKSYFSRPGVSATDGMSAATGSRSFVVTEIAAAAAGVAKDALKRHHLVKLSSVEDDGLGEQLEVIWELEPGSTVYEKPSLPEPSSFDHPKHLQAFLDAVRWGAISLADDKALQSPFRSGIELLDAP